MGLVAPRAYIFASGGACFVCQFQDECVGVEWGVCLYMCLVFFSVRIRVLSGGIGPIVPRIMAIGDPGSDALDSGEACFLRGCMGRGGGGLRVDELDTSFLSFSGQRNWYSGPPYSVHIFP